MSDYGGDGEDADGGSVLVHFALLPDFTPSKHFIATIPMSQPTTTTNHSLLRTLTTSKILMLKLLLREARRMQML